MARFGLILGLAACANAYQQYQSNIPNGRERRRKPGCELSLSYSGSRTALIAKRRKRECTRIRLFIRMRFCWSKQALGTMLRLEVALGMHLVRTSIVLRLSARLLRVVEFLLAQAMRSQGQVTLGRLRFAAQILTATACASPFIHPVNANNEAA
jgi:hypothetical protein